MMFAYIIYLKCFFLFVFFLFCKNVEFHLLKTLQIFLLYMCFVRYDIEEEKDYGGLDESGRWIGMVGLVSRHVSKKEMKVWYTGWVIELAIGHYQAREYHKVAHNAISERQFN